MQHQLKAIETKRAGYRFRSRLEARFSVFFDALKVRWEYEPEGFELPSGKYLPDFYLPDRKCWFEVKPAATGPRCKRVYLAGKMNGWRDRLNDRGHFITGPTEMSHGRHYDDLPGLHCAGDGSGGPEDIVKSCLSQIQDSDVVFAWIDDASSFASFAEIGYATARGTPIHIVVSSPLEEELGSKSSSFSDWSNHGSHKKLHDLWFLEKLSSSYQVAQTPQSTFDKLFGFDGEETLCAELATCRREDVFLVRGDPMTPGCIHGFTAYGNSFRDRSIRYLSLTFKIPVPDIQAAAQAARSARFEHGENGGV